MDDLKALVRAAEQAVLVAEMRAMVIQEEALAGLSIAGATRPLFEHELTAQIRFSELDDAETEALKDVEDVFTWLDGVMVAAIVGAFKAGAAYTAAAAADVFIDLAAAQPRPVRKAVKQAVTKLSIILAKLHTRAGETVIGEATRQGVKDVPSPPRMDPSKFRGEAGAAAAYHWPRLTHAVAKDVLQPGAVDITRNTIQKTAEKVGAAGAKDIAKQGIHHAGGTGRADTAAEMEPKQIWASELMDGLQCDECNDIDGKEYESMADALEDYPYGAYRACLGGMRCRGTLVYLF